MEDVLSAALVALRAAGQFGKNVNCTVGFAFGGPQQAMAQ